MSLIRRWQRHGAHLVIADDPPIRTAGVTEGPKAALEAIELLPIHVATTGSSRALPV
jgi:hypothetical protein